MEIITERLILREITWNDLESIHRLHSIPEVDEYNTLGIPKDIDETRELIITGFNTFHLHKVEAGVATGNERSIRVLEKAGMTREGLRRKVLPIRGVWKDNCHYAIVEDDDRDY